MNRLLLFLSVALATAFAEASEVDFVRDVRPILADHCVRCHGPDDESREADLRLDVAEDTKRVSVAEDGNVPELLERIVHSDPDLLMPPPDSGKPLSQEQVATLRRWIREGAHFESHWGFSRPTRPDVPARNWDDWERTPVDAFVARRLIGEELTPSPEANPHTLIRRLSLDLTGLPPTPAFVDRWTESLKNDGDAAYDSLVTELLASSHFGERWARVWLDAARYADSDGYEKDKPREAWFYRDWVINAINENLPYDQFIIRQIAGDLLPDATQADHVATGFLRNSMVNEEGGAAPEQFRMEAMYDRMDAIGKSVLGLTIQCAQCHSHKYDPLTHEEYYQLFAFLNNTDDAIIPVYRDDESRERDRILSEIRRLETALQEKFPNWRERVIGWAEETAGRMEPDWQTPKLSFLDRAAGGQKFLPQEDGSYLCQGYAPTSFVPEMTGKVSGTRITGMRVELLNDANLPRAGPGRSVEGTWALSEVYVAVTISDHPDKSEKVKIVRASADRSPPLKDLKSRYDNKKREKRPIGGIELAIDGDEKTAWTNDVDSPLSNEPNVAWFAFEKPVVIPENEHARVTVRLAQRHGGWNSDDNQTFNIGRFRISFTGDDVPVFDPLPIAVSEILRRDKVDWSDSDLSVLFSFWRTTIDEASEINRQIEEAWKSHPRGTTQLTLAERTRPRTTSLLRRGDFLSPVRAVEPGVPTFLHPLPDTDEPDRLRFARWLVSNESPTAARAIVNRIWQAYFSTGLVETSDDLGTQSAPPSHPELLDWLAVELMESGWDIKRLHRLIVSSATYRQSSVASETLMAKDPYNRLLARGARFRVPAETVRDIALFASGLLNHEVGGPSVCPPAPEFLFKPPASYGPKVWDVANDSNRYRRALYTFRFRSVPYPMLENFDAVPGNVACVRRSVSNTPMQALTALNEPLFVECSVAMAASLLDDAGKSSDRRRVERAFRRCVQRPPDDDEMDVLLGYVSRQRERIRDGQLDAAQIVSQRPVVDLPTLDAEEWAAWTMLCRVLLNLDETLTRE